MRDRLDVDERERTEEEREMRAMAERENRRAMSVACASVVRAASGVGLCAHELERATRTSPRTSPPSPRFALPLAPQSDALLLGPVGPRARVSREERGSQRRTGRGGEMQRLHEALDELEAAMERLRELYWELPAGDGIARDGRGE